MSALDQILKQDINNDVLPPLLDRLYKIEKRGTARRGFYRCRLLGRPERKIRRKSGEQDVILAATGACSKAEWMMLLAGLGMVDSEE